MLDKNNIEIKTGDVVAITGAYFKNDNGLYFVTHSPDDPGWYGSDHCLKKISKKGKISTAKYNTCFWPIMITTNSREKRAMAKAWNAEHAEIEVKTGIDISEIAKFFADNATRLDKAIKNLVWDWGEESDVVKKQVKIRDHYESVAKRIVESM